MDLRHGTLVTRVGKWTLGFPRDRTSLFTPSAVVR